MVLLSGRALTRTYRLGSALFPALTGVDIEVAAGEFLVLEGPSGSGKTTLINLLGLLDRPDEGELWLEGQSVARMSEDTRADLRRDRFGFIFQSFNLVPVLTAVENVEYPMTLTDAPREAARRRARELLARVGLAGKEEVRPDLLSGGERQRVAIARAFTNAPRVILADEPTANLDSRTASEVLELMRELNQERSTAVVVATHDPRVTERASRRLALRDGRIAA